MELKKYQRTVIEDFERYLDIWLSTSSLRKAYQKFWEEHPRTPLLPEDDGTIKPYNEDIKDTPHVCLKVPTAGGKTFLACNAIKSYFSKLPEPQEYKTVVWLTPSESILTQTENNLNCTDHPYRMRLDVDFNSAVNIFNKKQLLLNQGFTPDAVKNRLNIFVFCIDSLRARKKEDKKVYEGNGNLLSWSKLLDIDDNSEEEVFLMKVIQFLHPLVIIDESHNAVSELSKEMLTLLNPSFILDLTATPRAGANIISFIQAYQLKNENMVKLPVIVKNCGSKDTLLSEVIDMRNALENKAKKNPKYIRPIALIQAETRTGNAEKTFETIKAELVEKGIKEEQIKIKTAEINELKNIDLSLESCQVRYVITVNALKEGWDCPFAYILASYADRSSAVDVEQILGRILRLPYTEKPADDFLGASYVYTSSDKFDSAVSKIVEGLQASGFTSDDYRSLDDYKEPEKEDTTQDDPQQTTIDFNNPNTDTTGTSTTETSSTETSTTETSSPDETSDETTSETTEEESKKEEEDNNDEGDNNDDDSETETTPDGDEIKKQIKGYNNQNDGKKQQDPPETQKQASKMKAKLNSKYTNDIKTVNLPYFSYLTDQGILFGSMKKKKFEKEILLKDFDLSTCDCSINFDDAEAEFRLIDIDEDNDEKAVVSQKMTEKAIEQMLEILSHAKSDEQKLKTVARDIFLKIGNMFPLEDKKVEIYVNRIFEHVKKSVAIEKIVRNSNLYAQLIKLKIEKLETAHIKEKFKEKLHTNDISTELIYNFPDEKSGKNPVQYQKSLYTKEFNMNNFEQEVIKKVAILDNVLWWTRNPAKGDNAFCINGFINHFPDFIIRTTKGNTIILETKGDHLDAEDKIELGGLWEKSAGKNFKFYLVYDTREVKGAFTQDGFLAELKKL